MTISMKREELLKTLESQLRIAEAEDKRIAVEHRKDEQKALVAFKDKLRVALKWDYKTAKGSSWGGLALKNPTCPMLHATRIKSVIRMVNFDTRKSPFRISDGGDIHRAISWVPESKKEPQTVCD